jgi:hypothetical protein
MSPSIIYLFPMLVGVTLLRVRSLSPFHHRPTERLCVERGIYVFPFEISSLIYHKSTVVRRGQIPSIVFIPCRLQTITRLLQTS